MRSDPETTDKIRAYIAAHPGIHTVKSISAATGASYRKTMCSMDKLALELYWVRKEVGYGNKVFFHVFPHPEG